MATKKKNARKSVDYKTILFQELRDPELAAGYLTDAFHEGEEVFLLALKDVADARGGIRNLSKLTALNREGLYDMLSKKGNPRLSSLAKVLRNLGFQVKFVPQLRGTKAA